MSAASSFLLNRLEHSSHLSNTFNAETASASFYDADFLGFT